MRKEAHRSWASLCIKPSTRKMLRSIVSVCVAIVLLGELVEAKAEPGVAIGAIETNGRADYDIGDAVFYEEGSATQPKATSFQQELLRLVNIERAKANLTAVCLNSKLTTAAQLHASDMAAKNYFSHTGWNGSSFSQRIANAGFGMSAGGEIIAAGQTNPSAAMASWMNSKGHRDIILGANYRFVSAGYAYNATATWRHYWVQELASSRYERSG